MVLAFWYSITIFVSAALLFVVQPMVGRMLLPSLGGSPAVWNTCMVFFQAMLLLGYLYAHCTTRWLPTRWQVVLHLVLLVVTVGTLPIRLDTSGVNSESPAVWMLTTLLVGVGLPFFVVSTTGPLLQKWFATTPHRSARDPYFLYAASNAGSLLALLAYPLWMEQRWTLSQQALFWRWGYLGWIATMTLCALWVRRPQAMLPEETSTEPVVSFRWSWLGLSFLPSGLLLSVTTSLTTDITPIPLLWVIPLGLYLLTFILAFSQTIRVPIQWVGRILMISILVLTLVMLIHASEPIWLVVPIYLFTFFLCALYCHTRLASERPSTEGLTAFYLWMSVGGVLGGLFVTLIAPLLFQKLGYIEFPLFLVAVCWLRQQQEIPSSLQDLIWPILIGLLAGLLIFVVGDLAIIQKGLRWLSNMIGIPGELLRSALLFGLPVVLVYLSIDRPRRFALSLLSLFVVSSFDPGPLGRTIYLERNYLGLVRITQDAEGKFHRVVHGNTIHGQQRLGSNIPLTYYHPTGPAGSVFRYWMPTRTDLVRRIGVVGLGAGSLIAYAQPNEEWTFFELDPAVVEVAQNTDYFTFLRDAQAASVEFLVGDARLNLSKEPEPIFDLLVLDAFSSDAIPIHLLTAEAIQLYRSWLKPDGILLFHISNRYLDLAPILAKQAETQDPPMVCKYNEDLVLSDREKEQGKFPSQWLLMANHAEDLGPLQFRNFWFTAHSKPTTPQWTDDKANILSAWKWDPE